MITLQAIWASSTGLLERFNLMPTRKASFLKFQEEIFEMQEALDTLSGSRKTLPFRDDAADELADVLITLLNIGYTAGLTHEEIEKALVRKCGKNDAKSHLTHEIRDGQIAKRKTHDAIPVAQFTDHAQMDASNGQYQRVMKRDS